LIERAGLKLELEESEIHNRRPSSALRVYERILASVIQGKLKPGSRVVERVLAQSLAVSRTPVREAVLRLQQEGFLIAKPTREKIQLVVAPLSAEAAVDMTQILGALEGLAVRAAASTAAEERVELAVILDHDLKEFRKHLMSRKRTFLQLFRIDTQFHERFSNRYAGHQLRAMLDAIRPHVARYTWAYGAIQIVPWRLYRNEHAPIVAAIRRGDPSAAEKSVRANWANAGLRFHSAVGMEASKTIRP
jgi:DNA-binding GntR family transcriptional regulator